MSRPRKKADVIEAEVVEDETALVPVETAPIAPRARPARAKNLFQLAVATLSEKTQKAYAGDVKRFGRWWGDAQAADPTCPPGAAQRLREAPLESLVELSAGEARETVLMYQAGLMKRGLSSNTVARSLRSLNSIVKKLHFAEVVTWTLDVPVGKVTVYKDVRGPGQDRWKALLAAAVADPRWYGARDLLIIRLMGNDNLRASEIGSIRYPEDVREVEKSFEIFVHGKGDKNLWHPIHPNTARALFDWLLVRQRELEGDHAGPLVFSAQGNAASGKMVWDRVVARAKEAGIGHVHPHQLRHHAITERAKKWDGPMPALVGWARHGNANTTQIYVDETGGQGRQIADLGDEDDE